MSIFEMLMHGFSVSLSPGIMLAAFVGVIIGTMTGVLPGIGPVGATALLLPLSYGMDPLPALIMFAGIYFGSMYGGSTTAILVNVPGESASVVTCLDGYAMAKKGRGGAALSIAAIGSFVAGTIGLIGLTLFAPVLAKVALAFGPPEYFAVAFLGLIILSNLTGTSMIRSALMVLVGIMLGTIGQDPLAGINRFTFNVNELQRGIDFAILAMGVYGLGEVLSSISERKRKVIMEKVRFRELYPNRQELKRSIAPIFRGGILGFLTGLIPGPSSVISSFSSYAMEKKISKHPEEFGNGAIEGVAGPESANNAASSATMIPLLSLGIPFSATSALLLSGFLIHGITPGPTLINQHPDLFWGLIASMYIANMLLLIINLPLVGIFASVLRTPIHILMPIIAIITLTGAYAVNNSIFDLGLLLFFGVLGVFMKIAGFEMAPLVIGIVLGPIMEPGLIQGLIVSNGSILALFTRPLSGTLLGIAVLIIVYKIVNWAILKSKNRVKEI